MTPPLFPRLPGMAVTVVKTPLWSTAVKRAASGRERRTERWAYPIWNFEISHAVVRDRPNVFSPPSPITDGTAADITGGAGGDILDGSGAALDELLQLWEIFNLSQGQGGEWLFLDPADNQVADGPIGAGSGDGVTTTFQMFRAVDSWIEPVRAPFAVSVFDDGARVGGYSLGADGLITFAAAPAAGHSLTWSGCFYFVCRFDRDLMSLQRIVQDLWRGESVKFSTFWK